MSFRHTIRTRIPVLAALVVALVLAGAAVPGIRRPETLVILSTTDVKAKTGPCGCSIPKGGLSRRAAFADSVRAEYGQVALVDNGNFFPEDDLHRDAAWFFMDAMKLIDVRAVGLSPNELRFGYARLRTEVARTGLPVTSANLVDVRTKGTAFPPYRIERVGNVRVGFLSLMTDKADLGGVRDSLRVEEPTATARRLLPEMRRKGATVVVLLSQLGKVESEDLVSAVPGIDVVICGRNVPMIQRGRMIQSTIASYGGEQGQYISRTLVTVDDRGGVRGLENETFMLGPSVGEHPEIARLVAAFESGMSEKLRRAEKERTAAAAAEQAANADHFVGAEVCARCHQPEYQQWRTTSHAVAWHTLVARQQEAAPACIGCHVVGFGQHGGFQAAADVEKLGNVQCESCHGMGTRHEIYSTPAGAVTEATCVTCHDAANDAGWNWASDLPKVAHTNHSGETLRGKQVREAVPAEHAGGGGR